MDGRVLVDEDGPMRARRTQKIFRVGTWVCLAVLAVLSLLPGNEMVRTGVDGHIEHFVAYAGSAGIAILGYGGHRRQVATIACFWLYAGLLEYLQNFSPGRHPAFEDFVASSLGALSGALAIMFLRSRYAAIFMR